MKKIMLRKDYKTKVVPVAEAVGCYLVKPVNRVWNEVFVDEKTQENVSIERTENIVHRGCLVTEKVLKELELYKINEVEVSDIPSRAEEDTLFNRIGHVKVTVRNSWGEKRCSHCSLRLSARSAESCCRLCRGSCQRHFQDRECTFGSYP